MTSPKRNKRLRKKLYLDEFAMLGFEVTFKFTKLDDTLFDSFLDVLESRSLVVGGGVNDDTFEGFVYSNKRYDSVTEEEKTIIADWLTDQENITDAKVGGLVDAIYGG
jgi:uncharacterized protein YggL (DUF469 family)